MPSAPHIEILARAVCVRGSRVLLCRTSGARNTYLPGGHVEFGEPARAALQREIAEELGLTAQAGRFLGAAEHRFEQKGAWHAELNLLFATEIDGLDPDTNPVAREKHLAFLWSDLDKLGQAALEPAVLRDRLAAWLAAPEAADRWAALPAAPDGAEPLAAAGDARRNIVLVGFMGTGKTTVGRRLAARLGMSFADMDDILVQRQGRTIPQIFEQDGEAAFRAMERALVGELAAPRGQVIGTGGGIVLDPRNLRDFASGGRVVCLSLPPEIILERLAQDRSRPLLAGGDKARKIRRALADRQSLYDAIPLQIDRSDLDVEQTVDRILALVGLAD
jgi:shikimate kinase